MIYDRFSPESPDSDPIIEQREALLEQIKPFIPADLASVPTSEGADTPAIELSWVKVPDPRPWVAPQMIEVLPLLPVEEIPDEDEEYYQRGVSTIMLMGKLTSGEEDLIGYMSLTPIWSNLDPILILKMGGRQQEVSWQSADAYLWLTLAATALHAQPRPDGQA